MANTAVDRRRFQGPETSSPICFIKTDILQQEASSASALVNATTGSRQDDRKPQDVRPIYLKAGIVPQASGSAYIETGNTKIVCAVYGPHPTRKDAPFSARAKLNVEVKWTPFATPGRRRVPGKDTESSTLSAQLSQALLPSLRLDLLPKSAIDLYVTVLECDGPLDDISAGTTAASVALAQAGVQMYGLVTGCCAALTQQGDQIVPLVDPSYNESQQSIGIVSLACMPAMSSATNMYFTGNASKDIVKQVLETLQMACSNVHAAAVQALQDGNGETAT